MFAAFIWHHISLAMWEEWGILYLWYLGLKLVTRFIGIYTILILVLILVLICVLNIIYWYIGTYLYYSWWMCYLGMLHGQSNWSLSRQGQLLSEVWFHCIKNAQSAYGHIQSALTMWSPDMVTYLLSVDYDHRQKLRKTKTYKLRSRNFLIYYLLVWYPHSLS